MLYSLNLYSALCQLCLNKTGKKVFSNCARITIHIYTQRHIEHTTKFIIKKSPTAGLKFFFIAKKLSFTPVPCFSPSSYSFVVCLQQYSWFCKSQVTADCLEFPLHLLSLIETQLTSRDTTKPAAFSIAVCFFSTTLHMSCAGSPTLLFTVFPKPLLPCPLVKSKPKQNKSRISLLLLIDHGFCLLLASIPSLFVAFFYRVKASASDSQTCGSTETPQHSGCFHHPCTLISQVLNLPTEGSFLLSS